MSVPSDRPPGADVVAGRHRSTSRPLRASPPRLDEDPPRSARFLQRLLRPHWLTLVPLALSALVWYVPWGDHVQRGFADPAPVTWKVLLTLGFWYASIAAAGALGFFTGRRMNPVVLFDRVPPGVYYRYFTLLAAVGVFYTYGKVLVADPALVLDSLRTRTFNQVRYSLDYGAGVHTLRYAAVLSGGVACYELFFRGKLKAIHVFNVALLLAASAIASRLSLAMASLVVIGLFAYRSRRKEVSLRGVGTLAGIVVLAFVGFNYIRNAGFYEQEYGVTNPFVSNLYQTVGYLGAPFQGSVAVAHDTKAAIARSELTNGGAELGTRFWQTYGQEGGPPPVLTPTGDRAVVHDGAWAFVVSVGNPDAFPPRPQEKYVWNAERLNVKPGERYRIEAVVSGGSRLVPVRLGARVNGVSISQEGLRPIGNGVTQRNSANQWPLAGIYTVPEDVTSLELALWAEVPPRTTSNFAFDSASILAVDEDGVPTGSGRPSLAQAVAYYVLPTYAPVDFSDVTKREEHVYEVAGIERILTTNSAFASLSLTLGRWAFILIPVVAFLAAALAGHASRYKSYFLLATFVIGYCFAELWRVYLFNVGIIHFLLLMLLLIPPAHVALLGARSRLPQGRS